MTKSRAAKLLFGNFLLAAAVAATPAPSAAQGCNLPPVPAPGQTVTWTAADSPYRICETLTIPAGGMVIVEPGVQVSFDSGMQLRISGTLDVRGTASQHVTFSAPAVFPPMVQTSGAEVLATYADFGGQVRVETDSTVILEDCAFAGNGLLWAQELQPVPPWIELRRCTFTDSQLSLSDALGLLEGNVFDNTYALVLRGYFDLRGTNTATGRPFEVLREHTLQGQYIDGVHASGVSTDGGLAVRGGTFLLGPDNVLQGNRYALTLNGGLDPQSVVPLSGNLIDAINVDSGGTGPFARWPDLGLSYRMTAPFGDGGYLTIDPGVTVEAEDPGAGLSIGAGPRLIAEGLPDAPITFQAASPGGQWQGLYFHQNSNSGPHLEYVNMRDARFGVISSDNTIYVSNCVVEGNDVGLNCNSFGSAYIDGTQFLANVTGVEFTDLGSPILNSPHNPNAFVGNFAGIDAFENDGTDARNCWWGHPTGPQAPGNPDGQGDAIVGQCAPCVAYDPFQTVAPNFGDVPPVVRLRDPGYNWSRGPDFLLESGTKYHIRWDAFGNDISHFRIEYSGDGPYPQEFELVVDHLPASQRTYDWLVPPTPFAARNAPQFIRVIGVDASGQEGFDHSPIVVPTGNITGELTITTELAGQEFFAGEPIPDLTWTGQVSQFPVIEPMIVLENDGRTIAALNIQGRGVFFDPFPNISTDRARLAIRARNNSNDVAWFFADGYFSIRHDPRFGFAPPAVAITSPAPGASFPGGSVVTIGWTADAPEELHSFDVLASYDAGRTWHVVVQELSAGARRVDWRLPPSDDGIADVRFRVVARDRRFQNSSDDGTFAVSPGSGAVRGDLNCDGTLDGADIDPFFLALGDPSGYAQQFPDCEPLNGDINLDGSLDGADIDPFFDCLANGNCP